ncbi:MAG: class I SAM-dependent methyltransferase [Anaerolineae bacterium]|nr:class I SAM-dependent methyltransferase [Anaerolineae bacterium]
MTGRADDVKTRYDRFVNAYASETPPPWDSGIVPPEVRAIIEGDNALAPGYALDVGSGTGLNSVYLAAHGWRVTGVDWVEAAVERARARAAGAGVVGERVRFLRVDVTATTALRDHPPVNLWLDIGCLHGLKGEGLATYAAHAARLVLPGGLLRLYAWRRHEKNGRPGGIDPDAVQALFAPAFTLSEVILSQEAVDTSLPAAWYALRRQPAGGAV